MLGLEPQCLGNDVSGAAQVPTSFCPMNLSWLKLIIFSLCRNWHSLFDIFNFSLPFTTVLFALWFLLKYYPALPAVNNTHNFLVSGLFFFQILSSFYWHCPLLPLYFIILFSLGSKMGCLKFFSIFIAHFDPNFHILNHIFFPHDFCKLARRKLWVFFFSLWAINLILITSDITEVNGKFLRLFIED